MDTNNSNNLTSYSKLLIEQYMTAQWNQLCADLSTESEATNRVFTVMHEHGMIRCSCGSTDFEMPNGLRWVKCQSCRKKLWFTTGTFLEWAKLFRPWLLVFSLMDQFIPFSASQLAKITGIAYSTALGMMHKLGLVYTYDPGGKIEDIPSCLFKAAFRKRSKETPARCKPVAEEEELTEDGNGGQSAVNTEPDLSGLSVIEKELFSLIVDVPISMNDLLSELPLSEHNAWLSALSILEMAGLICELPGQRFVRNPKLANRSETTSEELSELTLNSAEYALFCILLIHQGVSRKYIQLYLALIGAHIEDKTRSAREEPQTNCFVRCMRFGKVSYRDIEKYVSPRRVRVVHLPPDTAEAA